MRSTLLFAGLSLLPPGAAYAQSVVTDNFNPPSTLWGNERGNWTATDGEYFAQAPSNSPTTVSLFATPFVNFTLEVDVHAVNDGGIWLRSTAPGTGILLVTGGNSHTGTGFYWHAVHNDSYGGNLAQSPPLFAQGDDIHVKVIANGTRFRAYCNGTLATTLTNAEFPSGRVGLYDFTAGGQRFANFSVRSSCGPADVAGLGGTPGPDALLTPDDIVFYLAAFFNGDLFVADIASLGGNPTPDDQISPDDLIAFLASFFSPCP